jgi:hypothetical protein
MPSDDRQAGKQEKSAFDASIVGTVALLCVVAIGAAAKIVGLSFNALAQALTAVIGIVAGISVSLLDRRKG